MKVLKSWGYGWQWIYDLDTSYPPNECYVALLETENERYYVLFRMRMRYCTGYEFSNADKMRAIKHYNEFKMLLKTEYESNIKNAEVEKVVNCDFDCEFKTPTLYSLGYKEHEDSHHPQIDTKPVEQVYIEGDYTAEPTNKAIFIPSQKIYLKTKEEQQEEKKEKKIEHDCRDYEQMNLFVKC